LRLGWAMSIPPTPRAIALLKDGIARISNVLPVPAPIIEIFEFTLAGPLLVVRPFCANQHYWQVYFDTNRMIRNTFGEAGFPAPEHHHLIHGSLEDERTRAAKAAA
jgi:small conductance mechanosensitive channel